MGTDTTIPPRTPVQPNADLPAFAPSTPASRNVPDREISINTPYVRKQGDIVLNQEYSLNASRSVVNEDLGPSIPVVPFEFFQDHVFPPLHCDVDISAIIKRLKDGGVILDSGRWDGFAQDPADMAKDVGKATKAAKKLSGDSVNTDSNVEKDIDDAQALENEVFAGLTKIISAIIDQSGLSDIPTLEYLSMPNGNPVAVYDKRANRPDGHFVFKDRQAPTKKAHKHRLYWRDFCTVAEFKLNDTPDDIRDDNEKTIWNIYKVMREDPRRRFVFAFTIQNTSMRVWFANRSEVFVTEPFNFIKEKEKFIHFVLAQGYAEDHQLGIDPTMKVVERPTSGRLVYDITVRDPESQAERVFRTKELINDDGTGDLRGRGTRVWAVDEVVKGVVQETDQSLVLKDSWIDHDRKREGQILQEIKDSYVDAEDKELFDDVFLTVVCHGNVYIDKEEDSTRSLMTRGAAPPQQPRFDLRCGLPKNKPPPAHKIANNTSNAQDEAPWPEVTAALHLLERIVEFFPKSHYRIVFLQRCEPLSKKTSLSAIFGHLASTVSALEMLHTAEPAWVHRDISAGNILIDSSDNARLADLEYCKEFNDNMSHHVRTGTVNFMAVEVDVETYLFQLDDKPLAPSSAPEPASVTEPKDRKSRRAELKARKAGAVPIDELPTPAPKPHLKKRHVFRYNPLHDLESLLWVAINFVINKERRLSSNPQDTSLTLTLTERETARQLFYNRAGRVLAMRHEEIIEETMRSLPAPLAPVGEAIVNLKKELTARYKALEVNPSTIGQYAGDELYPSFHKTFSSIQLALKKIGDVDVAPIRVEIDPAKRAKGTIGKRRTTEEQFGSTQSKKHKSSQANV